MMAFSARHWFDGAKTDTRYIYWVLTHITNSDEYKEVNYPMHRCTNEDFEHFYPYEESSVKKVELFKEGGHWFCFDWRTTDFDLYGTWRTDDIYSSLEARLLPCAS